MLRKFNYTDRIRILLTDVRFSLKQVDGKWSFDATLELEGYGLPPESLIFVEAYRQTAWMRFEWGTVGKMRPPLDLLLSEFDSPEDILFRVRVTSPGTEDEPHGLLLAEADRIQLRSPEELQENRDTIFPVVPTELGDELWKVSFDDERPRLLVNLRAAGNYKQFTLHPAFISLVYPAAMREVLRHILLIAKHRDVDDADSDYSRWLKFVAEVLGIGLPPDDLESPDDVDKIEDWVGNAVAAFSAKHRLLTKFESFMEKDGAL